jgi:hypothetical protein
MLTTFGWVPVAIAAIATLALLPALPLVAYLHAFGAATASSLLFVEAVVNVTAGLIPLAMVVRARSVAGVAAAEIVVAAMASVVVTALLPAGIGAAAAAAIPAWWIAALAARSACTVIAGRLALDREPLAGVYLVMEIAASLVRVSIALIAGSASMVIAISMPLHVAILVTIIVLSHHRSIDPARLAAPTAWGTWLAGTVEGLPLPLAVVWLGSVGITAPLLATSYVTAMMGIPFAAMLSREKIERSVRLILAPALAVGFLLAERTVAPALYSWLFPSLAIHRAWFEALGWLGVGLVAVPLPPAWQLARSEHSRLATALLGLAAIFVGGFAGLTGLVVGGGIARVLGQRPDPPASGES